MNADQIRNGYMAFLLLQIFFHANWSTLFSVSYGVQFFLNKLQFFTYLIGLPEMLFSRITST